MREIVIKPSERPGKVFKLNPIEMDRSREIQPAEDSGQLPLDIYENDFEILLVAPIAGSDPDSIQVVIKNDVLTIKGRRDPDLRGLGFNMNDQISDECYWGKFERSIILPPHLNIDTIEASESQHVMYVRIPKKPKLSMRVVKIKK